MTFSLRHLVVACLLSSGYALASAATQPQAASQAAALASSSVSATSAASSPSARVFTPSTPISNGGTPDAVDAQSNRPVVPAIIAQATGDHKLKGFKKLPVIGMSIVESTDGHVYLVSDDGRLL